MQNLDIVLAVVILLTVALVAGFLYVKNGKSLYQSIYEVSKGYKKFQLTLKKSQKVVSHELIQKALRDIIVQVEKRYETQGISSGLKQSAHKKVQAIESFRRWLTQVLGSFEKAEDIIHKNQEYISGVIDEFVEFSNQMTRK